MLAPTASRIARNTPQLINQRHDAEFRQHIERFAHAGDAAIDQRLRALDSEWDIERIIEVEAPATIIAGIALGTLADRRWFALSAFAAGMVILHSLQGWYPLLPLLRRLGVRSQHEIERERIALRALRGDQATMPAPTVQ